MDRMGIRDALTSLQVSSSVIIIVNCYLHRQLTTILQSDRNLQGRVTRRKMYPRVHVCIGANEWKGAADAELKKCT